MFQMHEGLVEARRLSAWHGHMAEEVALAGQVMLVCDCEASCVFDAHGMVQTRDLLGRDCPHAALRDVVA
jgi:hypothetical protein